MSGGVGGDAGGADELQLVEFCLSSGPDGGSTQGAVEQLEEDVFGRPTRHQAVEGGEIRVLYTDGGELGTQPDNDAGLAVVFAEGAKHYRMTPPIGSGSAGLL